MLRNRDVILLYLQFIIYSAFTFNIKALSKHAIGDANNVTWTGGWKCESNDECTAMNSICQNNLCQCPPEYIFNADMTSCIKVATGLYDSCEETVQCSAYLLSGAKCLNKVCVCGPGYYYLYGRCNRYVGLFEKCKRDIDCYVNADFEASVCNSGICRCTPGFYQREYRTCRREGKQPGDECTINNDCTFLNGKCSNFTCKGAFQVKEAVEFASDATSTISSLDANDKIRVGSNCTTNKDCRALGNAACSPSGTCRCIRAHFASAIGNKCIPELGEPCQEGSHGNFIGESFCRNGRWSCRSKVASKDNRECLKVARKYNGQCIYDEQCYVLGPDALCSNNKCVCNETVSHYIQSELFCWINKGVEENCRHNRDCYVKGFKGELICKNNICNCPDGMRLGRNKMACISGGAGLGGICEANDDCVILNSVCDKKVCSCAKNYYQLDEQCWAGINSTCASNEDCKLENSECAAGLCSCRPNYVASSINSCIPISSYNESCLLDIQCLNISGAICASKQVEKAVADVAGESLKAVESKVCTCGENDYYKFGKCLRKRFLGDTCANLNECYESAGQNNIVCKNGKCACNWGYKKWNSSVCVNDPQRAVFLSNSATNVACTVLFSTVLFYIFL